MSAAAHSQTLETEKPERADCSTVAPRVSFSFSSVKRTQQNRNRVNHVWLREAGHTRVSHTLAGNYWRDAPVLTLLTSLLGLSPPPPPKDPAPGLGRAPLPRRGPAPPPPPPRGDRSGAAPGPRLEAEREGGLDPVRPKGLGFCGIPRCHR